MQPDGRDDIRISILSFGFGENVAKAHELIGGKRPLALGFAVFGDPAAGVAVKRPEALLFRPTHNLGQHRQRAVGVARCICLLGMKACHSSPANIADRRLAECRIKVQADERAIRLPRARFQLDAVDRQELLGHVREECPFGASFQFFRTCIASCCGFGKDAERLLASCVNGPGTFELADGDQSLTAVDSGLEHEADTANFPVAPGRDLSRRDATDKDTDFSPSLEEAAERYERAGHPRTLRSLQRYCTGGHQCPQNSDEGDNYLAPPQYVARHIAQIVELSQLDAIATGRGNHRSWSVIKVCGGLAVIEMMLT